MSGRLGRFHQGTWSRTTSAVGTDCRPSPSGARRFPHGREAKVNVPFLPTCVSPPLRTGLVAISVPVIPDRAEVDHRDFKLTSGRLRAQPERNLPRVAERRVREGNCQGVLSTHKVRRRRPAESRQGAVERTHVRALPRTRLGHGGTVASLGQKFSNVTGSCRSLCRVGREEPAHSVRASSGCALGTRTRPRTAGFSAVATC